jgi:hypothetical protein
VSLQKGEFGPFLPALILMPYNLMIIHQEGLHQIYTP